MHGDVTTERAAALIGTGIGQGAAWRQARAEARALDERYEAVKGTIGWGIRDRTTGENVVDGKDYETQAWRELLEREESAQPLR